jgi:diadenosine tetraphosphate (Ap4A) HIT family hydrolase
MIKAATAPHQDDCLLCTSTGGTLIWENSQLRVIDATDALYPGFTRVIWQTHVREMTDLVEHDRDTVMRAVWTVESVMRQCLRPDKVNLASLGNMVAHVHWHIIPRFQEDAHFPDAVWATKKRDATPQPSSADIDRYHHALRAALLHFRSL